ncbi:uncharacterized protein HGUI_01685 [Hanseniaspora guilliermondii]|uniref:Uncharacterized protein n=1 Tax=Hanseniaspora guilliermondii TaxID=56406 RepID=A0A1L0CKU7_9ASCO|nr:uncharacterized protein HGUI_01685 [Hanseniaspora guilliermondii]
MSTESLDNDKNDTVLNKIFSLSNITPSLIKKEISLNPFNNKSYIKKLKPKTIIDLNKEKSDKHLILEKIERKESISSFEEFLLYKNVKGIKSDRLRAIKKLLKPNPKKIILPQNLISQTPLDYNESIQGNFDEYIYDDLPDDYKPTDLNNNDYIDIENTFSKIKGTIIFTHGYRGSTLRMKDTKERIWIPLKETILDKKSETENPDDNQGGFKRVLSNGSLNLLPLPNNATKQKLLLSPNKPLMEKDDDVMATSILKNIGPIDIMSNLIEKVKKCNKEVHVLEFAYDWRQCLDLSAVELEEFILNNCNINEANRNDIHIVAHSMGGLIAHKVMTLHPMWFKGVVYVGCPSFVSNILGPLRFGDSILYNKKILTPEVSFSFRSSFYFLPQKVKPEGNQKYGRKGSTSSYVFVNDEDFNIKYDLDFFDPKTWIDYKLSPCLSENLRETEFKDIDFEYSVEEHYEYLKKILPLANDFLNSLEYNSNKKTKYPPLAVLYGNNIPTTKGCRMPNEDAIKGSDWDDYFYGRGDGVISEKWLLPEHRGFRKVGKFSSKEGHVSLLNDIEGIARCFDYIINEWNNNKH